MKNWLMLLLLPLMLAHTADAVSAETKPCLVRSLMVDTLITDYGEQLAEVRQVKGKGLLEFHVSPKDGSWTAVLTKPNGISCVLAVGEGLDPEKAFTLATSTEI
ncbi:MAG TPA: hypothetical protein VLN73_02345 [Alphaproteobacteria bacterium]|nr:hypothetical protein [Alphaproteobacteria bacterium]